MSGHFNGRDASRQCKGWLSKLACLRSLPIGAALLTAGATANADVAGLDAAQAAVETPSGDPAGASQLAVLAELGTGLASYYGNELAGNRTASGERFDPGELTAAHRTLPFGSRVRVTSTRTGQWVVVRINDRGPFHGNRVIDLSEAAAREIGLVSRGSGQVQLALLGS